MGLFDKKICCRCGKKAGFLHTKLADGSYLCSNCAADLLIHTKLADVNYYPSFQLENLDREELGLYSEWYAQNLEYLREFTCTKSVGNFIHFDTDKGMMVFADKLYMSRRKKFEGITPPVFFLSDLCMYYTLLMESESYTTLLNQDVVESKVGLLIGMKNPVYDLVCVPVGTVKTKEGLFKSKTEISPEVDTALGEMVSIMQACFEYVHENPDAYVAGLDMKLHRQLLYRAKDLDLITAEELAEYLRDLDD